MSTKVEWLLDLDDGVAVCDSGALEAGSIHNLLSWSKEYVTGNTLFRWKFVWRIDFFTVDQLS